MENNNTINSNKKVTILIPCYNASKTILKALNSCLKQTYNNKLINIICCNDGSTDDTLEVLKSFKKNYDNNNQITILNQQNIGSQLTREVLVKQVSSEYFYFLDSDDYITNDCIESLVSCLKSDTQIVVSGRYIEKSGKIFEDKKFRNINFDLIKWRKFHLKYCENQVWNILYNTNFYKSLNFKFIKADYQEDSAFYAALLLKVDKIAFCNKPTIFWCVNKNSMSHDFSSTDKQLKICNNVYDNLVNSIGYINKNSSDFKFNKKILFLLISNAVFTIEQSKDKKIRKQFKQKVKQFIKSNNIKFSYMKMYCWGIRIAMYKYKLYK